MSLPLSPLNPASDEKLIHLRTLQQDFARFDTARDTVHGKPRFGLGGGPDNKVSKHDLQAVVQSAGTNKGKDFSTADVEAARFLLKHPDTMKTLDTAAQGLLPDGKISRQDVAAASNPVGTLDAALGLTGDVVHKGGDALNKVTGGRAGAAWDSLSQTAHDGLGFLRDKGTGGLLTVVNQGPVRSVVDKLPFNNSAVAALQALHGDGQITLDKDAIARIKQDPAFVKHESDIIKELKARPEYGHESFSVPLSELTADRVVELGGKSGEGSKLDQAKHFYDRNDPDVRATWKVAGNDLTWVLRHATFDGTAHVDQSGNIKIDYRVSDKLDLRPNGTSGAYDTVTRGLGTVWHDWAGAKEAKVVGDFSTTRKEPT